MNKALILVGIFSCSIAFKDYAQKVIPIQIPEYNLSIEGSFTLRDTILHEYAQDEYFRFVFFDYKGKSYCERYIGGKLCEKGYYANSLDTLKKYIAGKYAHGKSSSIGVLKFFQPLKDGEWMTYKNGSVKREKYVMGVLADKLVPDE